jgi:hypothetical protein
LPASSRLGVPWLAAATAEAEQDLSRIRGHDGVRLGAGSVVIEGRAFDLDPEARSLEVLEPSVRLRAPRARIDARRLEAAVAARRGRSPDALKIALDGAVTAQVELPFPLESGRTLNVTASAERLQARPRPRGGVDFRLEGAPARLAFEGAAVELEGPRIAGKIRGRHVVVEGELNGRIEVVASAFPERRAVRRPWRILAARRVELAPATTRPAWWFGGPVASSVPRRLVLADVLVEVLFRPTWA